MWGFALLFMSTVLTACSVKVFENNKSTRSAKTASIIGGSQLTSSSPLMKNVALLFNRANNNVCTVTLWNTEFAVTAAHCVYGMSKEDLVLFFDTEMRPNSATRLIVDTQVIGSYLPSYFNRQTNTGDLAVIRIQGKAPPGFSGAVLMPETMTLKTINPAIVIGYGVSNEETLEGAGRARAIMLSIKDLSFSESEMSLAQTTRSGACHGDSGGPVYSYVNGTYYLVGIISRSINNFNCSEASIATNILLYSLWVKEAINTMKQSYTNYNY